MRICYLCPDLGIPLDGIKGASAHVRGIVRAIKSLGHDIVVVTSSANGDAGLGVPVIAIPKPEFLQDSFMKEHPRMARALNHTCNNVMTAKTLLRVIDDFHPEFVYERYSPFGLAGGTIAKKKGIFHTLEVNALLAAEGKSYRKQALQEANELIEQAAFNNTSLIITVSDQLRESLIASGISPGKVITVPNGVDEMFFAPLQHSLRENFEGKIVIGFIGSLKAWHGIDILADSFRKLADDPIYHLLVVGDGPMRKILRQLEDELPGRVTCTGGISHEQVPEYIDAMDIAVAPYPQLEEFYFSPLKVLEYMARGKAIIASNIGQIAELIYHGETGWMVPAGDIDSFVKAIRLLSHDQSLREKMGQKAAKEVREQHSWRHRATYILDIISKTRTKKEKPAVKEIRA